MLIVLSLKFQISFWYHFLSKNLPLEILLKDAFWWWMLLVFFHWRYLKLLPSFLKDIFAEHRILNWQYFQNRNIFPFPLASIFLMRNLLSFELVFSYRQYIIILSGCFQKILLIVFSLHQFAYNMSRCEFLWLYPVSDSFNFPVSLLPNLESFQPLYFQMFFQDKHFSSLLLEIHLHEYYIYIFLLLTHRSLRPYPFFSVFFSFSCLDWIISIYLSSRPWLFHLKFST